jgi:ABC-type branched-subunit amino acid transport system permease subunit
MSLDLIAYAAFFLTMALTYAIMCLGLNVQWGQTGLFNVGIAAFVAIGAYVSALLTTPDAVGRVGGSICRLQLAGSAARWLRALPPGSLARSPSGCDPTISPSPLSASRSPCSFACSTCNRSPAVPSASASFRGPSAIWLAIPSPSASPIWR